MNDPSQPTSHLQVQLVETASGYSINISEEPGPAKVRDTETHQRLVRETIRQHKAWLLTAAIMGDNSISIDNLAPLKCAHWDNSALKKVLRQFREAFDALIPLLFLDWVPTRRQAIITWLAQRFDDWEKTGFATFDLGRVHEVEQVLGPLGPRQVMHCPPYAQIVLQQFFGAGIRFPEYHLASDMALLFNLFLDAEQLQVATGRKGEVGCSEHNQSLGRSVIQTCFSLLEAFMTGLASEYLHKTLNAPRDTVIQLKGRRLGSKDRYLRVDEKFELFPSLITSKQALDMKQQPFRDLFGKCKQQRNVFAHPSMPIDPIDPDDKYREQKEARFHDITLEGVRETVDLTCEAICVVWQMVHGTERPSWLPKRQADGRFPRVRVTLAPAAGSGTPPPAGTG